MVTLTHRSRSRSEGSLLPISTPTTSSGSPFRSCGIAIASLLLLGGGAGATVSYLSGRGLEGLSPAIGETVRREASVVEPDVQLVAQPTPAKPAAAALTATPSGCRDSASRCAEWAKAGECARNAVFMHKECIASCGLCDTATPISPQHSPSDNLSSPSARPTTATATLAATATPATAMQQVAVQADGKHELRCYAWAAGGECEKNPAYMREKCKDACVHRSFLKDRREKEEA